MDQKATAAYKTQEIMTASPARLVAMLFDRAIASLNEAIEAIKAGDIERRWNANRRAIEVVAHLAMTLDMEKGGQIAQNLDQLYRFVLSLLPQIDLRNDVRPAEDAIRILEPLRVSWHELSGQGAGQGAGQPAQTEDGAAGGESEPAPVGGVQISA